MLSFRYSPQFADLSTHKPVQARYRFLSTLLQTCGDRGWPQRSAIELTLVR